jgi:ABC-type oligopeptide transport system ATPase subunit
LQVGIVGRTGSGKTTLLMALFRMIGLAGGRIVVDGVDIGNMPLREVRSAKLNSGHLLRQPLHAGAESWICFAAGEPCARCSQLGRCYDIAP